MFVFSVPYQQLTFSLLVTARDVYIVIALSVAFYFYMSRMRFTHAKAFEIPAANKCIVHARVRAPTFSLYVTSSDIVSGRPLSITNKWNFQFNLAAAAATAIIITACRL